jgi:hypothetical protein
MLRRAGAFATPTKHSVLIPDLGDSEAVLESKWRKWVERESFKRYAFIFQRSPQFLSSTTDLFSISSCTISMPRLDSKSLL